MFQAAADPLFEIADELIPGTDINFRDAFVVTVSPNVVQSVGPGAVPEPGHLRAGGGRVVCARVRAPAPVAHDRGFREQQQPGGLCLRALHSRLLLLSEPSAPPFW
jgi:hypothetical protein